jgi:hypothetical protein
MQKKSHITSKLQKPPWRYLVLFSQPVLHLLYFPVPICPHTKPRSEYRTVDQRKSEAHPQAMEPIMKLEGEKDTQWNPENVVSTYAEHSSQQLLNAGIRFNSRDMNFRKVLSLPACLGRVKHHPPPLMWRRRLGTRTRVARWTPQG